MVKKNVVTTMQKVEDNMDAFNKKIMPLCFIWFGISMSVIIILNISTSIRLNHDDD